MQVSMSHLTELTIPGLEAFDLDPDFGLASLQIEGDDVAIYLNNSLLRSWTHEGHPQASQIRWFARGEVVIFPKATIVSTTNFLSLSAAWPTDLFLSRNHIFAAYNEEQFFTGRAEHESDLVSVLSRTGGYEFSLMQYFNPDRDAHNFMEVEAAYCFDDHLAFIAYDSDKLWIFDAGALTYRKIQAPFSLASIQAMTGDEKKAYAIFDNRYSSQHYPDLPPFELAVFDLVAGTAVRSSFAPVEAALIAAGFDPAGITLQPNASGRIIVSDGKKAALLEFCDGD
jgi:hypothetical protein